MASLVLVGLAGMGASANLAPESQPPISSPTVVKDYVRYWGAREGCLASGHCHDRLGQCPLPHPAALGSETSA